MLIIIKISKDGFKESNRLYDSRKISIRKVPTHQTPPGKISFQKIPTQKFPTWNVPTHFIICLLYFVSSLTGGRLYMYILLPGRKILIPKNGSEFSHETLAILINFHAKHFFSPKSKI